MSDDKNLTARVRTFVDEMINHSSLDMRATVTDDENGNILVVFQGFEGQLRPLRPGQGQLTFSELRWQKAN
mgnify:CR=1 FL=1